MRLTTCETADFGPCFAVEVNGTDVGEPAASPTSGIAWALGALAALAVVAGFAQTWKAHNKMQPHMKLEEDVDRGQEMLILQRSGGGLAYAE